MKNVIFKKGENKIPIKSWVTDLEDGALEQAKNLSNLPFSFKHISLMPDCHQGYGMPIGGVMATNGYVIPNAVGVDIGCFEGKTKVPLLDGSSKTLKELTRLKNKFYVYSLNQKGEIVPGKAKALLTKRNAKVMQVCISGGEVITCTPDHKFMLLDGTYKEAKDLKSYDSLMPLYRSYESGCGYEHIRTRIGTGIATHKMIANYFLNNKKTNDIIHHKDENWYNNDPSNIEYKNKKLHISDHRKVKPIFGTNDFKEKRLKKLQENGFYDKKYIQKKKEIGRQNFNIYNKSDKKKEQDKLAGKRGRKNFIKDNQIFYKCEVCEKVCKGLGAFSRHKKIHENNHKVLWTKQLNKKIDVYCLQVEKYHNFALQAGIFVHNCGMCALKTSLNASNISTDDIKKIMGEIRKKVPVGFSKHQNTQSESLMPGKAVPIYLHIVKQEWNNALTQLGTLGGGNHFIELQKDEEDNLWIMIHSGSRNIGLKVAKHYNDIAKEINKKYMSSVPPSHDLAFLPLDSKEGKQYLEEMNFCVEFALANRKLMMERVQECIKEVVGEFNHDEMINIAHNYVSMENHFGENVWVHRKGATKATKGLKGIIPGSQGTCSYIVEGLGNPESFESCSHGAGRNMGRKEAQRTLNLEEEKKKLNVKGIIHGIRNIKDLDEASGAYKDIQQVMSNQDDLVKILVKLEPLGVIKG